MNDDPLLLPDDNPNGVATQPLTGFCTSTNSNVVPPFLWHEYEKEQVGTTDAYTVTVRGNVCVIGTGAHGEQDARTCCIRSGYHYIGHTGAQVAVYTPLGFLLLLFLGIAAYQAWRRDVARYLNAKWKDGQH